MNRIERPSACSDFLEVFTDFVDGTLPPDREGEIRAHLDCCEGCLHHLAAYRRGVMALRAHETDVDPQAFWTALERRLWTEGHLGGGREPARGRDGRWWSHPAVGMAAAACFAVVVFFAGMWGDRALHSGDGGTGDRPVVVRASVAGGGPIVLESEPIDLAGTTLGDRAGETRADARATGGSARTPRRDTGAGAGVPVVHAALDGPATTAASAVERPDDAIERASEISYVASLDREAEALETIERTRARPVVEGLRGAWSRSAMTADGWIEPVRLGTAGLRRIRARAPVTAWPVEAALSLP